MSTPARKTRPHGDERRRSVLAVATDLFSQRGYNAVSIADVAKESGLSQAGLLHHFPTKRALLLAVLQERDRASEGPGPHGADFLQAFAEALRHNDANPQLVQLFALLSAESISEGHPAHDWFVERYDLLVSDVTTEVASIVDPDKLPEGIHAETLARWVIALADGLRTQALLSPGAFDRADSIEAFLGILRPYLRTDDTGESGAVGIPHGY
ncbi:TetR/AcrR family transcriptional regulator [Microbacterium xanthum]|uniref:TetR/AcrR family transcriptional regulator n=1 Tax=Microbacterium xanthum TaxID=3079794 RepID=UPI002AD4ACD6|nr:MULTISPECIES: TetR/AcrR family transcriptional regulator [unclassified Microbacterium]MDZ8171662.1 TetR/AcrR family transcriptional regulator [Microbacterium sp. KSW-48]MDZ8200245.1 TetR/AcrR family transcriptional regulator [Microbacterium sp. SSW1-59]